MTPPLAFRRAREDDIDRLVEIHNSAFPDPRGFEARERNFRHNRFGTFDDLRVAEQDGVVVAHAFLFGLRIGFGGALVQSCGIASVGVAPEARGRGVAGALLAHLHAEARARGDALSVLFAFRQGFYAKHGYASASSMRRLVFSPDAIPRTWRPDGVRAARGDDRVAIAECYARALHRRTGWIERTERQWDELLSDEQLQWFVATRADGAVAAYLAWSYAQEEEHAQTTMRVRELVADDADAERALLALVGAQRDQVHHVTLDVAADDPLDRVLVDADRMRFGTADAEHVLGEILGGPMVCIVDAPRALASRGYSADGAVRFVIADGTALTLHVEGGKGRVDASNAEPTLHLAPETLAALAFGALRASDAARLGLVRADDARAVASADRILALPPYFALDPF